MAKKYPTAEHPLVLTVNDVMPALSAVVSTPAKRRFVYMDPERSASNEGCQYTHLDADRIATRRPSCIVGQVFHRLGVDLLLVPGGSVAHIAGFSAARDNPDTAFRFATISRWTDPEAFVRDAHFEYRPYSDQLRKRAHVVLDPAAAFVLQVAQAVQDAPGASWGEAVDKAEWASGWVVEGLVAIEVTGS